MTELSQSPERQAKALAYRVVGVIVEAFILPECIR
jgi:hypothetical protein